jgi:hypothetical protein
MLKTVSSITNAIGALNYKGTWNASTNTPDLAASSPQKGDYYVVSVAGSTSLGGISTWYVGDWAVYNGAVWQRVEGGEDDPAPSVRSNSSTGVLQVTGPAAASTRVMTVPDANFTAARTDAAQTFTGNQTFFDSVNIGVTRNSAPLDITGETKLRPTSATAYAYQVGVDHTDNVYQKMLTSRYLGSGTEVFIDCVSWATYIASASNNQYEMALLNLAGSEMFKWRYDGVMVSPVTYTWAVGGTNRAMFVDNTGTIGYNSSIRKSKTNITPLEDASWLLNFEAVSFNRRKKNDSGEYTDEFYDEVEYGLIAEQVETVNNKIVFYDNVKNEETGEVKKELRGVHYDRLVTPLLKLVQQQQKAIDELKAEVAALKGA